MKYLPTAAKVIFSLILILPILGSTGIFPEATRDIYQTDLAFAFIEMLTEAGYITFMMAVVHIIALIALWTKREPLAALLELPISLNVAAFHMVIDGGLFTGGAWLGNLMLIINVYLLWKYRDALRALLMPRVG